jgi:hypothetical protein
VNHGRGIGLTNAWDCHSDSKVFPIHDGGGFAIRTESSHVSVAPYIHYLSGSNFAM